MIALRHLSAVYLAAASSFAVAIALADHPTWNKAAHEGTAFVGARGAEAALALNRYVVQPDWAMTKSGSVVAYKYALNEFSSHAPMAVTQKPAVVLAEHKPAQHAAPVVVAKVTPKKIEVPPPQAAPTLRPPIVETAPEQTAPADNSSVVASATPPHFNLAPQASKPLAPLPAMPTNNAAPLPPVDDHPPSAAELAQVSQHFRESLTKEMLDNFELFLFVSKANAGARVAQRMYVFQKQGSGDLVLLHNWPVSTGREKVEVAPNGLNEPSFTPAGYYELDPNRMYVHHWSGQWKQPMPYAMFFNWQKNGLQTGLAIHGADGADISLLGTRASAGCVRLSPENARTLFSLIKNDYKGLMPKFAYDKRTATMSNDGVLVHTTDGRLQMAEGYKVLVFIEDYGGEKVVAALF